MALNTKSLTAPGDVAAVDGARVAAGLGGGGGSMPTWGVGDPVATAVAGFQKGMERFKRYYDDAKVNEFLTNKAMELDKMYYDKDNGLFNVRKGENAQGMYQEGVQFMRDMWEKDAQENLSDEQRAMVGKGMQRLFSDYGHRIAKYETDEMINGTKNRLENTLFNAKNLVASGDFTEDDLGLALNGVRSAVQTLGNLQGFDAETIKRQMDEQTGDLITKSAIGLAATKPEMARGMLMSYKDMIPSMQYEPAMKTITKRAEAEAKRQASVRTQAEMSGMLANLDDAQAEDVLALAQEKYPNDLGKQTKFMNQWNSRQNALARVQKQKNKAMLTEFGGVLKSQIMGLPLEQRNDAAEQYIANLPDDVQEDARKLYYNYEKFTADGGNTVKANHPGFLRKASERIAKGEVFDVAGEYGARLTPETVKQLSDKGHQELVKRASKAFHAGAMQYIGGNKDRKKEVLDRFGSTAQANLWQQFYEDLPDSVKENPKELDAYAKNFWKEQTLDRPKLFGLSYPQKTVPLGWANQYIEEHEDENWQVARVTDKDPYRQATTDVIKAKGQKYTDENYSRASREVINSRLTGEIE